MKKLNLPSTLTYQKAYTLFFLTMLNMKGSDAGQAFRNCLENKANDKASYGFLLGFPFNINPLITDNSQLEICCNKTKCSECLREKSNFYCRKIFDNILCGHYPTNCVGVIGNASISENKSVYGATCPISPNLRDKFDLARDRVNAGPIIGLDLGYGFYDCSASDYCLKAFCGWDNGGWICSWFGSGTYYCYMQWPAPWPGPADFNPFPTNQSMPSATTSTSVATQTNNLPSTQTNLSTEGDYLIEKIAIPIGTILGTSLISGLTYYYCKRCKRIRGGEIRGRSTTVDNRSMTDVNVSNDPLRNSLDKENTANTQPSLPWTSDEENEALISEKETSFLRAKATFIDSRKETIEELQHLYDRWNDAEWKNNISLEIGNIISGIPIDVGFPGAVTIGVPAALGSLIKSDNFFFRLNIIEKGNESVQIILKDSKEDLAYLEKSYNELHQLVKDSDDLNIFKLKGKDIRSEVRAFQEDYLIFEVLNNVNLWKGKRYLKIGDVENAIKELNENLRRLNKELASQFETIKSNKQRDDIRKEVRNARKVRRESREVINLEKEISKLTTSLEKKIISNYIIEDTKIKRNAERKKLLFDILNPEKSSKERNNLLEKLFKSKVELRILADVDAILSRKERLAGLKRKSKNSERFNVDQSLIEQTTLFQCPQNDVCYDNYDNNKGMGGIADVQGESSKTSQATKRSEGQEINKDAGDSSKLLELIEVRCQKSFEEEFPL